MKSILRKLTLCALSGAAMSAHAAPVLIPNGDFSSQEPAAGFFSFFESAPGVVSFPATGGSGDNGGYGLVNNTVGVWGGGLVSPKDGAYPPGPNGQGIPLGDLGLVAGNTYTFSMDMKNFAGTGTGGIKLESWKGGNTADSTTGNVPATGSSSQWANYSWNYTIPPGTLSIKIVPLVIIGGPPGGSGASTADSVGFDNIKVNNTPVPPPPFVPDQIINGNFETPGGAGWGTTEGTPAFPTTGGNPDGNAVLDGTGGFTVLYAFNNTFKTFASLGLAPGDTYTFQMDMRVTNGGTNIGFVRLQAPVGYVNEQAPAISGDVSQWATYSIQLTVPDAATAPQIKFGLRPGAGSIVAFDNVKIILPGPPPPVVATIEQGTVVGWTVNDPDNTYQPQKRDAVEDPWTDIGGPVPGTSVPFAFEETASNFYQVLETTPGIPENGVLNPGFENLVTIEEVTFAENWTVLSAADGGTATIAESYPGGYSPHSGTKMLVLESATPLTGPPPPPGPPAPNVAVSCANFAVTENTTYDLSFWAAHVVKTGGANPQFILEFFGDFGFISNQINSFATVGSTWTKVEKTFTTPEGAVAMRILLIQALGADYAWQWVTLLDDFELLIPGEGSVNENAATAGPGVEISWNTNSGKTYQVKSSGNLVDWSNFGSSVVGDGNIFSVADPITPPGVKFYRVGETP
jgi:hypothetical protein